MQKNCPICGKVIRVSEVKVSCLDCQVRSHLKCLDTCELYHVLQHKDYIKEDQISAHHSTIPIRCVACLKKGTRQAVSCLLNSVDFETFYVPVKLSDSKTAGKCLEIKPTGSVRSKTSQGLGKRDIMEETIDQTQLSLEFIESTLQNQIINDYISVNGLIELQNHGQKVAYLKEELTYELSREVLEKYKGYNCACGISCAFNCAYCHLNKTAHALCLQSFGAKQDSSLHCLECFRKNSGRQKRRVVKVIKQEEEVSESKVKEQKSKTIRLRNSSKTLLDILDGVCGSGSLRKLTNEVLRYWLLT